MFLGGLWHGASWNFVVWGMLHGIALAVHKMWITLTGSRVGDRGAWWRQTLNVIITFHFVCFCWIFFRNADFTNSATMLTQITCSFHGELLPQLLAGYWKVFALIALGYLLHFTPARLEQQAKAVMARAPFWAYVAVMVAAIYLAIQMRSTEIQPFIYFQF